ncbi:MAG: hypothetical protein H7Z19_10810 [Chitinophagaceae bacterium]|nr:hypothetical protein [Rubrivivax sp.]
MKKLLLLSAVLEIVTGLAMLAVPVTLSSVLFGALPEAPLGVGLARMMGSALLALGVACAFASRDTRSSGSLGVVAAMLVYNLAAAAVLLSLRFGSGLTGIGLLPAGAAHVALALWCALCISTVDRISPGVVYRVR